MKEVALYQGYKYVCTVDLNELKEAIRTGTIKSDEYKLKIERIRDGNKFAKDTLKKSLPAVSLCGVFRDGVRQTSNLQAYSGLVIVDVDKQPDSITRLREEVKEDAHVLMAFLSPSGDGFKMIFRVDDSAVNHEASCHKVWDHVEDRYKVEVDRTNKDLPRLTFLSYDPDLYVNDDASTFEVEMKKNLVETIEPDHKSTFELCTAAVESRGKYVEGNRNNFIYELACEANRRGIPQWQALRFIAEGYKGLGTKELVDTIQKAYSQHQREYAKKQFEEDTIEEFIIRQNFLYNSITNRIELSTGGVVTEREINTLFLEASNVLNPRPSITIFTAAINSSLIPDYNPLHVYFNSLKTRKVEGDPLEEFLRHITIKNEEVLLPFIGKWLISVVASAYGHIPDLVLVLIGPQGNGKTEFFTRLLPEPVKEFFAVDNLDRGKDSDMLMCSKLIVLDDEFGGMSKKDAAHLKAMVSKGTFSHRLPYGRTNQDFKRLAVLCGTSNNLQVLNDPTGNRRVIPVELISRNFKMSDGIDREDLWAQLVQIYFNREDDDVFKLTRAEYEILNNLSGQHQLVNPTQELIEEYFEPATEEAGKHMSASQIAALINSRQGVTSLRVSTITVGKELSNMGFDRVSKNSRYGYWVREKKVGGH